MQKDKSMGALRWSAAAAATLVLAACGGGGGGGGSASTAPQGTLQLAITDAPACYESVLVTVDKVRVHMNDASADTDDGWKEIVPANGPVQVDLLNLTNGQVASLGGTTLDAGTYRQLRLVLAENTTANPLRNAVKPVGGALVALKTPSGQQSGLKVKTPFEVQAGQVQDMVLDFDACKSIVATGAGTYLLKPVVRLTPKPASGIQGYVATTMTLRSTTVSAQRGGEVVRSTVPDATGKFTLAYLPAGTYTVVITSEGRATGVVDSVPVGTTTLALNDSATAIALPTSAMNTASGTVTAAQGNSANRKPVDDAIVAALQTVAGTAVEVTSVRVDDDNGRYTVRLPVAAPVKAPYAAGALAFTADAAAAGKYTLKASAEGRAAQQHAVDLSGGTAATVDFSY